MADDERSMIGSGLPSARMSLVSSWLRRLRLGETPRLMILAGLVGVGAGLGAVVLIKAIEIVSSAAQDFGDSLTLGRAWPFIVLPAGVWLSWRLTSWLAPEVSGHGVPQIIAAIALRGGRVRARVIALKTVATALTIGSGGSAGREGSIAQIGSAIGAWVARLAHLSENDVRVLVAAGAGAGISATFNAPIAGMFFAMEVILQEFALRHVHTIVIASVAGAVVSHSVIGEALTFIVSPYALDDPRQLLLYALLGLIAVAAAWLFLVALDWFEIKPGRLPTWTRPLLLAFGVALLGFLRPEVLGSGQDFVESILRNEVDLAWWTLGILAVLKAIATAATLGGRGSGGIFMPSLFIGATTGAGTARSFRPSMGLVGGPAGCLRTSRNGGHLLGSCSGAPYLHPDCVRDHRGLWPGSAFDDRHRYEHHSGRMGTTRKRVHRPAGPDGNPSGPCRSHRSSRHRQGGRRGQRGSHHRRSGHFAR